MHQSFFLPRRYAPSKAPVLGYGSAGTPTEAVPYLVRQRLPIPLALRRFGMFILRVDGDSMTLPDGSGLIHGAYVLVDSHDIYTDRGYVFSFRLPDSSYVVKRLQLVGGRPAMCSDNQVYEPIHLHSGIRNCGKVYAASADGKEWQSLKFWIGN